MYSFKALILRDILMKRFGIFIILLNKKAEKLADKTSPEKAVFFSNQIQTFPKFGSLALLKQQLFHGGI